MQVMLFGGDFGSGIFSDFACRNPFRASNLLCTWLYGEDLTKLVYLKKRTQPGHPHLPPPCAMEVTGNGAVALWQGPPWSLTPPDSPTEWHLGNSCPLSPCSDSFLSLEEPQGSEESSKEGHGPALPSSTDLAAKTKPLGNLEGISLFA